MNNALVLRNLLRAAFLLALQVLVFNQINLGGTTFNYISVFVYPISLLLLPISMPMWMALLAGFAYGYIIDVFSDTIGINAAACVFSIYARGWILRIFEPQGGYKEDASPTRRTLGFIWFLRYSAVFMLIHVFVFFSVEEFTPFYWKRILFSTIPSFLISLVFVMIYSFLFDPAE